MTMKTTSMVKSMVMSMRKSTIKNSMVASTKKMNKRWTMVNIRCINALNNSNSHFLRCNPKLNLKLHSLVRNVRDAKLLFSNSPKFSNSSNNNSQSYRLLLSAMMRLWLSNKSKDSQESSRDVLRLRLNSLKCLLCQLKLDLRGSNRDVDKLLLFHSNSSSSPTLSSLWLRLSLRCVRRDVNPDLSSNSNLNSSSSHNFMTCMVDPSSSTRCLTRHSLTISIKSNTNLNHTTKTLRDTKSLLRHRPQFTRTHHRELSGNRLFQVLRRRAKKNSMTLMKLAMALSQKWPCMLMVLIKMVLTTKTMPDLLDMAEAVATDVQREVLTDIPIRHTKEEQLLTASLIRDLLTTESKSLFQTRSSIRAILQMVSSSQQQVLLKRLIAVTPLEELDVLSVREESVISNSTPMVKIAHLPRSQMKRHQAHQKNQTMAMSSKNNFFTTDSLNSIIRLPHSITQQYLLTTHLHQFTTQLLLCITVLL